MSDLIKREDAINAVEMFFKDAYIEDADVHCTDMVYEINHIPAASPGHRVEEPPKEDGDYLTYYVDRYCAVNHWSKGWGWWYDEEAVRYWMPIEPPKEDV